MPTHGAPAATAAAAAILLSFVLADLLSVLLRGFALRHGVIDGPAAHKAHRTPTPYLGGVAIAVSALAGGCLLMPSWDRFTVALVVAGTGMALLGLLDDLLRLSATTRLLAESLAATAVVLCGEHITLLGNPLDLLLTICWIVVLTNSYNLLDNMDGAAAVVAVGTACFLAVAAYLSGRNDLVVLLAALGAGCLGFLLHNWAPARMFMGDAGSLFLGFLLCSCALQIGATAPPVERITVLLLFTFVATADTCLVVISRRRAGRSVLVGGTDHASHRLHRLGPSVPAVAALLLAATALSGLCAVLLHVRLLPAVATFGVTLVTGVVAVALLLRVPVYGATGGQPAESAESAREPIGPLSV